MMRNLFLILTLSLPFFGFGQCYPDRHNTSWNENWYSCKSSENPNPAHGAGHWIVYDFGNTYTLGATHFWNINAVEFLDNGFKDFYIDYSQDGKSWKQLGQYTTEKASGLSTYEGSEIANFAGDTARFVLFTAINNWGGQCYGIAEVRFDVTEVVSTIHSYNQEECFTVSVYPNPHAGSFSFALNAKCEGAFSYTLYDNMGKALLSKYYGPANSSILEEINTSGFSRGLYHLVIYQNGKVARYPVIKSE